MALTTDRNSPRTTGTIISAPVAAGAKIFAGALVAFNASGYLVPASDTAGLRVAGVADEAADNMDGQNGAASVKVSRGAFKLGNSASKAVAQANVGGVVYVEDDETVAKESTKSVVAGVALELDGDGVWVDVSIAGAITAANAFATAAVEASKS